MLMIAFGITSTEGADVLIQPKTMIVNRGLSKAAVAAVTLAPLRYDTFWNSGDEHLARAALADDFVDHTLPPGRVQGPEGPLSASRTFRAAVPDLACDVEQMIVAGDRVTAFLHFRGHFTGNFNGHSGKNQSVDFIAIDIYRIKNGKISEDWHLEDNLTLLQQLGVVAH
jgi:predicted ester cyclase